MQPVWKEGMNQTFYESEGSLLRARCLPQGESGCSAVPSHGTWDLFGGRGFGQQRAVIVLRLIVAVAL